MNLAPPYSSRPLTAADATAVFEVMAADQRDQIGRVDIELEDIVGDWARPSFDVAAQTIGVFCDGVLVGYAEHSGADRGDAAVHPDHRGRSLGTALAAWMQKTARAAGANVVGMPVPAGGVADRFLAAQGYRIRWTSWVLRLPADAVVAPRPLPPGYEVREARRDEYEALHGVIEDAFLEWSVRERQSFEDFLAETTGRPGFAPWMLRIVTDETGDVVAAAWLVLSGRPGAGEATGDGNGTGDADGDGNAPGTAEAWVTRLATRADQRRRGLAQALLADCFAVGREHGAGASGLSTDSRTGALGLYERVGMVVVDTWVNRAIGLERGDHHAGDHTP